MLLWGPQRMKKKVFMSLVNWKKLLSLYDNDDDDGWGWQGDVEAAAVKKIV